MKIQVEIPEVFKASELMPRDDPFEIYRDIIEESGGTQLNARRVWALLKKHRSRDNAIKQTRMSEILGLNGAMIRACVNALRRMGFYVCSGSKGYYVSREDIQITIDHLESRAKSEWVTAACLKRIRDQDRLYEANRDKFQKPPRTINGNLFDAGINGEAGI
ncbi:MAG TPA: hypothetical protein ENO22_05865 [candidate division Zixibacteria bacterium]|mgnify:CR=1 FL=1|nr:hypothetical protein [candidate division Zixibacteria bacterium]HEQ98850.1 hypothetical protein [candidate division Zixibacteria bacterium]